MREPELPRPCLRGKHRRFPHRHVLIAARVVRLVLRAVHPLTDEEIRVLRHLRDDRNRPGIRTVYDGNPPSFLSHDHLGAVDAVLVPDLLSVLKPVPVAERNPLRPCPLRVELPKARDADPVAIAADPMIYAEGLHLKGSRELLGEPGALLRELMKKDGKGELGRDDAKAVHHSPKSLRSDDMKLLLSLRISHA